MKTLASILLLVCTAVAAHAQVRISELPEATSAAGAQFVIIQGGATKRIAEGTVRTIAATNVTGLGPFAVATNLVGSDISDFASAVVAAAPPTTNAALLTSGTLEDARIPTNIARTSQLVASNIGGLGPFASATNLAMTNVTGLQGALDGKLATNGTLPAGNITGLGPFATATNLTAAQIGDFSNAVVAVAPATTNAAALTVGTLADGRLSTNVVLGGDARLSNARAVAWVAVPVATNSSGSPGQLAYTNNFLYVCVGSNAWRRVQLGTWGQ